MAYLCRRHAIRTRKKRGSAADASATRALPGLWQTILVSIFSIRKTSHIFKINILLNIHFINKRGRLVPYTPFRYIVPYKYWKYDNGSIVEMTQQEKDELEIQEQNEQVQNTRLLVKQLSTSTNEGRLIKAVLLVILDEVNILRNYHGASTRTLSQLMKAIERKIDNGDVD